MFEAQLLNNRSEVYSPWMGRGGDNVIFTLEIIDGLITGTDKFEVQLYTKNSEDVGDGAPIGSKISESANDRYSLEVPGLTEEMVRYKFSWNEDKTGDWVLFRMLAPVWFDEVKA